MVEIHLATTGLCLACGDGLSCGGNPGFTVQAGHPQSCVWAPFSTSYKALFGLAVATEPAVETAEVSSESPSGYHNCIRFIKPSAPISGLDDVVAELRGCQLHPAHSAQAGIF